ncbi:hemerythrin domain-containing protein [Streptomyces sparsogenes]|uniref:hemerythrin domain-containing protein n=1 Tax=Streptomyces sparsogenes TaxID=67365 RepID=UPI0034064C79
MTRSIAEQTVAELGGRASVLTRQRREHAEIDRLMVQYALTSGPDRERALKALVRLVASHAFAEETVLWPALRRLVPEGEELTARVEREHQEINDTVAEIERMPSGDPRRAREVERVFTVIRQDIRDEEDLLLPRLRDTASDDSLHRLGVAWAAARRTAPTHPHPTVPRRPPGNAALGIPLSATDRMRDLLGQAPAGPPLRRLLTWGGGLLLLGWTLTRALRRAA